MSALQMVLSVQEDGSQNVTVFVKGKGSKSAHSDHPNFQDIVDGATAGDESVFDLFDIALSAGTKFQKLTERVMTANGKLYFDGVEMNDALTDQVIVFLKAGVDNWKPLVAFYENVMQNPNEHSREQLYTWIKAQNITLTDDGMLVGYKGVSNIGGEFFSKQSGTAIVDGEVVTGKIPNKVGSVVEMTRTEVMHDPKTDCDAGLHVGSFDYAKSYADTLLEVHVNPRDVVSVPDASWKLRTCRYTVIGVLKSEYKDPVKPGKSKKVWVKKGDLFEDTDKRRAGRQVKVKKVIKNDGVAVVESLDTGKFTKIALNRLSSRKYRKVN